MSMVDHMNQDFCANVYDEARQIAADGFPRHQRDLFMEQGAYNAVRISVHVSLLLPDDFFFLGGACSLQDLRSDNEGPKTKVWKMFLCLEIQLNPI